MQYTQIENVEAQTRAINSILVANTEYDIVLRAVKEEQLDIPYGEPAEDGTQPTRKQAAIMAHVMVSAAGEDNFGPAQIGANAFLRGMKCTSEADQAKAIETKKVFTAKFKTQKRKFNNRETEVKVWFPVVVEDSVPEDSVPEVPVPEAPAKSNKKNSGV